MANQTLSREQLMQMSLFSHPESLELFNKSFIDSYRDALDHDAFIEIELRVPLKSYVDHLIQNKLIKDRYGSGPIGFMFTMMVTALDNFKGWHHVDDWAITEDTTYQDSNNHHQFRQTTGNIKDLPDHQHAVFTRKTKIMDMIVEANNIIYPPMKFSIATERMMDGEEWQSELDNQQSSKQLPDENQSSSSRVATRRYHTRVKERKSWFLSCDPNQKDEGPMFRIDLTKVWSGTNETMAHWHRKTCAPEYELELECVDSTVYLNYAQGRCDVMMVHMIMTMLRVLHPAQQNMINVNPSDASTADYNLLINSILKYESNDHLRSDQNQTIV